MSKYEEALKNLSYDVHRLCKEMGWEMDNKDIEVMKELIKEKKVLEKALELACKEIGGCRNDCSLPYMNACNPSKCIYAVEDKPSYFKTKAEEMMKSE